MGRSDMEHPWLLARCREVQLCPDGYLDLWAREHYKSTIITFGLTIQNILASHGDDPLPEWNGVEPTFGIFSHTRPIAKGFLRQIKYEFESNELLKAWFPDILWDNPRKESPKWSEDDGIVVKRKSNPKESTVEAWGLVDGQPTSKHFWGLIYDDVVTLESVTTPEMAKKTTDRWEVSLNLGTNGGFQRYIGTRYADTDTYGTILERDILTPRIHAATYDGEANGRPVLMPYEALADKRRAMSPYNFACQMLLDPIPDDTAYFKHDWVQYYTALPKKCTFWAASDYAVTANGGDYTVHGIAAVDSDDNLYIVDWWRERTDSSVWIEKVLDLANVWKPRLWLEEAGQINKSLGPFIEKRMRERGVYFNREQITPTKDKATRAQSIRARMAMSKVYFPQDAPFTADLVAELLRFPVGKNDDQVDVLSLFGLMLDKLYKKLIRVEAKKSDGEALLEKLVNDGSKRKRYGE